MDEVTHTILPNSGSGWGGALGAGFGGLIGSWLGNGGFGGFGGNRAGIGYDTGAINGMANQLNNISGQIAEGTTTAGKIENCYHAAVALLRYWRILENKK